MSLTLENAQVDDPQGRRILGPLSLQLSESRIGVVGNNGCGKSTLLRLLAALQMPSQGCVRGFGTTTQEQGEQWPRWVGVVFQNTDHQLLFPTVIEELAFGMKQLGWPDAEARAQQALAERPGWAYRRVHELSGGEKKWVCLRAVLLMQTQVLLLDEPSSGLDQGQRRQLRAELAGLEQQQIIASHDPQDLQHCERVIWLEQGRVRAEGAASEVLEAYLDA